MGTLKGPNLGQRVGSYREGHPRLEVTLFLQRSTEAEIQEAAIFPQSRPGRHFPFYLHRLQVVCFFTKKFGKRCCPKNFKWFRFLFLSFFSCFFFFFLWLHVTSNYRVIYGLQVASCCGSHTELCFLNLWLLPRWPWNHSSPLRSGHMASEGSITFKGRSGLARILIFYFKLIPVIKQWCV